MACYSCAKVLIMSDRDAWQHTRHDAEMFVYTSKAKVRLFAEWQNKAQSTFVLPQGNVEKVQ